MGTELVERRTAAPTKETDRRQDSRPQSGQRAAPRSRRRLFPHAGGAPRTPGRRGGHPPSQGPRLHPPETPCPSRRRPSEPGLRPDRAGPPADDGHHGAPPARARCTWRWCWTPSAGWWWAGRSPTTCEPTSTFTALEPHWLASPCSRPSCSRREPPRYGSWTPRWTAGRIRTCTPFPPICHWCCREPCSSGDCTSRSRRLERHPCCRRPTRVGKQGIQRHGCVVIVGVGAAYGVSVVERVIEILDWPPATLRCWAGESELGTRTPR
jgi:hypothetical protein